MARRTLLLLAAIAMPGMAADPSSRFVHPGTDGRLVYVPDARGDRLPDFSHAGYGGGAPLPDAPIRLALAPSGGDDTPRIQAALDALAARKPAADGLRGTLLLLAGRYQIRGQLQIRDSGLVLRGQGKDTCLVATGTDRRALIRIHGRANPSLESPRNVADKYVPVGAATLTLASSEGLSAGDAVRIEHPSTKAWIATLGMDRFPSRDRGSYLDWKPGTLDLTWERGVTKVVGNRVTLDVPLPASLDASLGAARVRKYSWPGRVRQVGVENLRLESASERPLDEDHAWTGVTVEKAEDVWVRRVSFAHFCGSAVALWESARRVTVEDCASASPVSEVGGGRRVTYFTAGQQTLFLRCTADGGRHDFAVGHQAAGPNAFVHCKATNAHDFSGPIGSWATGVLYDNVTIDGGGLALTNRETDAAGTGWAAANSVLWQCSAPVITCRMPPTASNWAIGVWGRFVGDGHWRQLNEFTKPDSLYAAQLADRSGGAVLTPRPIATSADGVERFTATPPSPAPPLARRLSVADGRLVMNGKPLAGKRLGTAWWRGSVLPARATEVGVGVTRFVPSRVGPGYTDDLDELTDTMRTNGVAALEHHWGLWYDRRRDDHNWMRRPDADVWPPFYEQPWARSGRGKAFDGLSRYDLARFNPWYFGRLRRFADVAAGKGLVLVQHMYFQHNVLEAAAHWADFPWRPANCVQETGFPEPPTYAGGKRVFMAEAFYDVDHPVRRDLHRRYIRHCLDVLGGCPNVIFHLGEEYTGPRAFVEFWLDTVAEWQLETGKRALVGLGCTKDVQDAILADPKRGPLISIIDLKYWWYTADGGLYAPRGGESLTPRQQMRVWKGPRSRSDASVARAVREYRARFPDKAVTLSFPGAGRWAAD